jgi:ribosome-associated translation inhibitor RaiA
MQISITGPAELTTDQVRAYTEYRVFAALSRFGRLIDRVTVTLEREAGTEQGPVVCVVDVATRGTRALRCRGSAAHATEAVNCVADRARRALQHRTRDEVSV